MPASKRKQLAVAERRAQAIELFLAGVEYGVIADRLGYPTRKAAWQDVTRALEKRRQEQTEDFEWLRAAELERLNRLRAANWKKAVNGDAEAGKLVLAISARLAKLFRLEQDKVDYPNLMRLVEELLAVGEHPSPASERNQSPSSAVQLDGH